MFRFASPLFLILLGVIPIIFYINWNKRGSLTGNSSYQYSSINISSIFFRDINSSKILSSDVSLIHSYKVLSSHVSFMITLFQLIPILKYAALALMIVALARPQWGTKQVDVTTEGINIILALDLSESMAALDFSSKGKIINRLDAVKSVVNDFIMKRDGDRIGMVVFGSQAFTQLPLTRDYNTISFVLERLKIGAAGPSTAIGDAIGISLKRLQDIKSKSNIIILLTDGSSNSGELDPETAASIAAEQGVKIYTIGVGKEGKAPFLVNDPVFGQRYVYQRVDIDHETLKRIAEMTKGTFFTAEDVATLEKIYKMIDNLEKTKVDVKSWAEYNELYLWFLTPALILLVIYMLLSNTRFIRVP
ncbi:MAG: VWA domain-containing protein [Desulfamplus sp.]|nr:VWA domain-containing protein [Desulfamplus sp.]